MKRRLAGTVAIGASALLALPALAACGSTSSGSGSSGQTTLTMVVPDYGTGPANTTATYWQAIITAFEKQNPKIKVTFQIYNWDIIDSKVQTMLQNKQYPDIIEGESPLEFAQDGIAYPASKVLSASTYSNMLKLFMTADSYKGTAYGMPFTTSSRTLFYNKLLFAKAGIASPPTTWAQLKADAAKIKQKTGKIGFGLPLGSEEAEAESLLWFLGNGGGYLNSSGKYDINSSQNIQTFQFLNSLVKAGDTEPGPGTQDRTPLWEQFAAGQVGMINGSPALIPIIQAGGKLTSSDWASTDIAGKNGPLNSTLAVADSIVALNTQGHASQIKQFLDFVYQNKYQLQFDKEYDLLPATTSAINALSSNATFAPFLKRLPSGTLYPSTTNWQQVDDDIKTTIGSAIGGNPASVLGALQQKATSSS
jgi:multiple sugar transport system substrate-binding protein